MAHKIENRDGLRVYILQDMNRRYNEEGELVSSKGMDNLAVVHARDIAEFYGIPLRSVGRGDNEVRGVWAMVYDNEIGQRVPYNTDEVVKGDRLVRTWKILKDANGEARSTEEKIVKTNRHWNAGKQGAGFFTEKPIEDETDDGMYVRLDDLKLWAEAQGWTKGGGRPGTQTAKQIANADQKLDQMAEAITALTKLVANIAVKK